MESRRIMGQKQQTFEIVRDALYSWNMNGRGCFVFNVSSQMWVEVDPLHFAIFSFLLSHAATGAIVSGHRAHGRIPRNTAMPTYPLSVRGSGSQGTNRRKGARFVQNAKRPWPRSRATADLFPTFSPNRWTLSVKWGACGLKRTHGVVEGMPRCEGFPHPRPPKRWRRRAGVLASWRETPAFVSMRPELAIQAAIADRFHDVRRPDVGAAFEVGNGAGHAQDAVVGAGGKAQALHRRFEQLAAFGIEGAETPQLAGGHAAVHARRRCRSAAAAPRGLGGPARAWRRWRCRRSGRTAPGRARPALRCAGRCGPAAAR